MLYLVDESPGFTFLATFARFLLPLPTMESDRSNIPDPPPIDPKPPDRSILPTPSHPPPPRQTNSSIPPMIPPEMDLARSLKALQLSSRAAATSSRQAEDEVETQYNLLMKVADPQGTARDIPLQAARLELQNAWKDSYGAINETKISMLSFLKTVRKLSWVLVT